MAREITTHKSSGMNNDWQLIAADEPGPGGANHHYMACLPASSERRIADVAITFQYGPVKEVGINGITNEILLAVVRDRLEGFQRGQFACDDNQEALDHIIAAMNALQNRTAERTARGVEGFSVK